MLSKELLEKVKTLGEEDKLQHCCSYLIDDLSAGRNSAYEVPYAIALQRGGSAPVAGLSCRR